jgi:hypothetical protein
MSLDSAPLREIPVGEAEESVFFRAVQIRGEDEPEPLFTRPGHGRWPTDWTLYTGTTAPVAWAEYCRNNAGDVALADVTGGVGLTAATLPAYADLEVGKALPKRSLYELLFEFTALADLTTTSAESRLVEAGFDLMSFYADERDGYGDCPELASLAEELGWEALRVPSAAWQRPDGYCVPVFELGKPRLVSAFRTVDAASPSVAMAVATTYPVGRRPAWLGEG